MSEPTLRERIIAALAPYFSAAECMLKEHHEAADAALAAILDAPITEEEIEAVAFATYDDDDWLDIQAEWDECGETTKARYRERARAAIVAYRAMLGRKG